MNSKENHTVHKSEDKIVSLEELAGLTGFPLHFLKKELLLENGLNISMDELREKVLKYLDTELLLEKPLKAEVQ